MAEGRYLREPADNLSPEKLFERRWAQNILENALKRLRSEYMADSQPETYAILKGFEPGEQTTLSYGDAAARLGISESALKSKVHRLRQRHRELVREEIAQTVCTSAEVDQELRHMLAIISA